MYQSLLISAGQAQAWEIRSMDLSALPEYSLISILLCFIPLSSGYVLSYIGIFAAVCPHCSLWIASFPRSCADSFIKFLDRGSGIFLIQRFSQKDTDFFSRLKLCASLRNFHLEYFPHQLVIFSQNHTKGRTCEDYKELVGMENYLRCESAKFGFLCYQLLSFWLSESEGNNAGRMAL